jgi:hypothetical protein
MDPLERCPTIVALDAGHVIAFAVSGVRAATTAAAEADPT